MMEVQQQQTIIAAGILPPPGTFYQRCVLHWWKLMFGTVWTVRECVKSWIGWPYINIKKIEKRTNRTTVLTGGTRGIGLAVLKMLLQLDYTVILGVRNIVASQKIVQQVRTSGITTGKVKCFHLDLKSLTSVKTFAEDVISSKEGQMIHLLINNAGISQPFYEVTEDGFEAHFQVNYLSHFLLTRNLLPRIKETAALEAGEGAEPCFIVNITSYFNDGGHVDLAEFETCNVFSYCKSYYDSKLSQILHVQMLEKIFQSEGLNNIHAIAINPGAIPTDLWTDAGGMAKMSRGLLTYISRNTEDGAHAILSPILKPRQNWEVQGGSYFSKGSPASPNSQARDEEIQNQVWAKSLKLTENW